MAASSTTPGATDADPAFDVVVVGSGAAALTAATVAHDHGAAVVVLERADELGGTSAVSGGVLWMPGNHHMAASPAARRRDMTAAREYVHALARHTGTPYPPIDALLDRFVRTAREALVYLERTTPLRMAVVGGLADYSFHAGLPGACGSGRSVEPVPYSVGAQLGEWAGRIARRGTMLSLGAVTTLAEDLGRVARSIPDELHRRTVDDVRTKGAALVAMLVRGLLDRGVPFVTGARASELVVPKGAVAGVVVDRPSGSEVVAARRGVVLACGGYEWNRSLVSRHVGYDVEPLTPSNNVGDGLSMASAVGADQIALGSYWGQPAMFDPTVERDGAAVPQFEWVRGAPSSFVVDHTGVRFANEALPYHEFAKLIGARGAADGGSTDRTAWLVFDHAVKRRNQILSVSAGDAAPGWFACAETAEALARSIGVPPEALARTLARFDHHAARGEDPDFLRTELGMTGPGRVAPLAAPYYALALHPGTIGTSGGLRTDALGRVQRADASVIDGLYAVGNTAASPLGDVYPGAGSTLGPAVTFAYLAGRSAAVDRHD